MFNVAVAVIATTSSNVPFIHLETSAGARRSEHICANLPENKRVSIIMSQ
jgi:hypothetical protein